MEQTLVWRAVPWKTRLKAFLGRLLVGWMWLGFIWLATRIYATSPLGEVFSTLAWLANILAAYLVALALWIGYNVALYRLRPREALKAAEAVRIEEDYFGRPVSTAIGSTFGDRYLTVEMIDGHKVYVAQSVAPEEVPAEPLSEPVSQPTGRRQEKAKHAGMGEGG